MVTDYRLARASAAPLTPGKVDLRATADILVFEHVRGGFEVVGGQGRGAGWAGIVRLEEAEDSLVGRAWRRGVAEHMSETRARQMAGPYYASHAVAVPVGQRHVVVFGDDLPISARPAELTRLAAIVVDQTHGVPADKLLADELEVVEALRSLMAYRPETVRETLRHVAYVAARALSCDVALIRVERDGEGLIEGVTGSGTEGPLGRDGDRHLRDKTRVPELIVVQAAGEEPDVFGVEIASRMTIPLGTSPAIGALALGHASANARGFTSLCQRIGRAIADTAELLISQAEAREQLAAERDLLRRLSTTDALTGLPNRRAFDQATVDLQGADGPIHVVSCDLDGLKAINDRFGHAAGDEVIRAVANLLRSTVRATDLVARLGGDEFALLLIQADAATARRVTARIRQAERVWQVTEHAIQPRLSLGVAAVNTLDIASALSLADSRMYVNKRRRHATSSQRRRVERRAARRPQAAEEPNP
jgi:diguanylate cyclase (GGDEF)-like protein